MTKCPEWLSGDGTCYNDPSPDVGAAICGEWSANGFDNDCFRSTVEAGISSAWAVCEGGSAFGRWLDLSGAMRQPIGLARVGLPPRET